MKVLPNCEATRWSPAFIDVIPAGGGKHVAIEKIMEYYGYKKDEIMAFGDGGNDIDMIKTAGCGVAMANGCDEIKRCADVITRTNDEEGVAYILEKYI